MDKRAKVEGERIGGHLGMDVVRYNDRIWKYALHDLDNGQKTGEVGVDLYDRNADSLRNEHRMLGLMRGSGFTPEPISSGRGWICQEDLGPPEGPQDAEAWRHNCIKMLGAIRARGLRHGDLKGNNIITRDDWPKAIDWQEGHRLDEVPPQKSPFTDSMLLMQNIANTKGPQGQVGDTPRVARRWGAVLGAMGATTVRKDLKNVLPLRGKTLVDYGCFQGEFPALAASEGMTAVGIDMGGFRSGENSLDIGRDRWSGYPFGRIDLFQENLIEAAAQGCKADVALLFSTFAYIVKDFGRDTAQKLLSDIMANSGVLFFETQLAGDGPGPAFLETDSDVEKLLTHYGKVRHLARIHVAGRPAFRSVWKVEARA